MGLSEFIRKIFADSKSRVNEAGQAVVEYILVLLITVSLILGVLYQFNDAFRSFLDSYFGDYIACLLETGELPALGGQGPNQGECNTGFGQFSISQGRPKIPPSNSSGNNSSGSNGGGSGSSSDSASNSRLRPSSLSSSGGSGNAESFGQRGNANRPSVQSVAGPQNNEDPTGFGDNNSSASEGSVGRGRQVRKKIIVLGEDYLSDKEKNPSDKVVAKGKKTKKESEISNLKQARFPLSVPQAKQALPEIDGKGFSFAFFIKFLLIAAIIIALLLFLGGQAMQIKKSWQKSE